MFGTDPNKCQAIMILIFFAVKLCDKMNIQTNCESYPNGNIYQSNYSVIFCHVVQP